MKRFKFSTFSLILLFITAFLSAGSAIADKPPWAGGGKSEKHGKQERRSYSRHDDRRGRSHKKSRRRYSPGDRYFYDRHRTVVHDYYVNDFRRGFCPPGLAKKGTGCMPPGQAKKWVIGQPLPRDLIFYNLPPALASRIGPPPPGYRFVRVASDILMITIGTGLVIDAIHNLGRY
ncbi:MAG: RcnB family protein [Gammaproteobacteria bacterium]